MASITIRSFDDAVKQNLHVRAAQHGWSMEEEARDILRWQTPCANLGVLESLNSSDLYSAKAVAADREFLVIVHQSSNEAQKLLLLWSHPALSEEGAEVRIRHIAA